MVGEGRILVAYGTKYQATAGVARAIGETLREARHAVDVRAAGKVESLDAYSVVVLGSAVYMGRWRRDAMRLLRRPELPEKEVWLFSCGPVGEVTADNQDDRWTGLAKVERAAEAIGAREHVVFGGAIADDAGFLRRRMARRIPPELRDLRDWTEIEGWARKIARSAISLPRPEFAEPDLHG